MFTTGKRATRIINKAMRDGMSLAEITVKLDCTPAIIYRWRRTPTQRVNTRLTRALEALKKEMEQA